MIRTDHVREPQLLFAHGKAAVDPRLGMLAHGPAGLDTPSHQNGVVRVGAVGTHESLSQLHAFFGRFMHPWAAEAETLDEPWRVEFPGLGVKGPLGFEFALDPNCIQPIFDEELAAALAVEPRAARVEAVLNLYKTKLADLEAVMVGARPSLIVFPLSEQVIERCKDPTTEGNKIMVGRRNVSNEDWVEAETNDFHHALKAMTFPLQIPCQLLQATTMRFEGTQDAATVAWNLATGMYYKATGHPWKLADIDNGTCIVGISFYREPSKQGSVMRASMAHVYFRKMESQVIRGKPFVWKGNPNKDPTLNRAQATDILTEVLGFFGRQRHTEGLSATPKRVVVHKSSPFTDDEIAGLDEALPDGVEADYVSIDEGKGVRFYHGESGYPPVRGTLVYKEARQTAFLYTTGFVPALRTYPGSSVPAPISFRAARLDTSLKNVAEDIMALTRLDWNSTEFCTRQPVTISVSRKVGAILAEARARGMDPPTGYRFYM
jgi:hypothetical protein